MGEEFVVASYNVHAGVDGWGRPFDVVEVCRSLDADVIVLEESWSPLEGQSLAERVGTSLGYGVTTARYGPGRLVSHDPATISPRAARRWGPSSHSRRFARAMRLEPRDSPSTGVRRGSRGVLELAVLSRLSEVGSRIIRLPRLPTDRARRAAIALQLQVGNEAVTVLGTHLGHVSRGSVLQLRRLHHEARRIGSSVVLAGDLNSWGPVCLALLPHFRRAVRGKTWPAWRPHSQVDHVLVSGAIEIVSGETLAIGGSDHRPIRARLRLVGA